MKHVIRVTAGIAVLVIAPTITEARILPDSKHLGACHSTNVAPVVPWNKALAEATAGSFTVELVVGEVLVTDRGARSTLKPFSAKLERSMKAARADRDADGHSLPDDISSKIA